MAKPVYFPQANFTLLGPAGTDVLDLHCYRGQGNFVSCWELSDDELEEVIKTRRIFVGVQGAQTAPPIWVAKNPFITQEQLEAEYFKVQVWREADARPIEAYVPNKMKDAYWRAMYHQEAGMFTEDELKEFIFQHS